MDIDYEDNIEIISETINNLEQAVSVFFYIILFFILYEIRWKLITLELLVDNIFQHKYYLFFSVRRLK